MIYNHVVMRGNLGHVPELRKTSKGQAVTNVSIAVYNGKDEHLPIPPHIAVIWP